MSGRLLLTILGCGSSGGVPRADGNWGACDPGEPKNRRRRCSVLVRRPSPEDGPETTLVVDTSPDFREQAIAAKIQRLDGVLFTHDHADQTHGLDDIRAFALNQRQRIPAWMDDATWARLEHRFGYIFHSHGGYPAISELNPMPGLGVRFEVAGPSGAIPVVTFDQEHGEIRSLGFRFGSVAYSPDVNGLPESAFDALEGVETWIVDALRYTPHPTHAHLAETLRWIERVQPRRAILTNMHIDMDFNRLRQELPEGVEPAWDGMVVEGAF
ncbi:MAG: MBL fold metallo-hydrolase [Caulobacter sp.]|nr:MBL fold metallo-hydrolase [Caulobacter sp.]